MWFFVFADCIYIWVGTHYNVLLYLLDFCTYYRIKYATFVWIKSSLKFTKALHFNNMQHPLAFFILKINFWYITKFRGYLNNFWPTKKWRKYVIFMSDLNCCNYKIKRAIIAMTNVVLPDTQVTDSFHITERCHTGRYSISMT